MDIRAFLTDLGLSPILVSILSIILTIAFLCLISFLIYMVVKLITKIISVRAKTMTVKDLCRFAGKRRLPGKIAFLLISIFLSFFINSSKISGFAGKLPLYLIIAAILLVIDSVLNLTVDIYGTREISKKRPIKGIIQILKIVLYIIFALIVISLMINQSPLVLIGGIGTFTAIISIVFKDALLGLVAGFQITADDLLRIGDWVDIPSEKVEGTVSDISLISVKILAFDNTLYTIPAYTFLSVPFKNWHTAISGKARRIMRTIPIDASSVRKLTDDERNDIKKRYEDIDLGSDVTNLIAYTEMLKAELKKEEKILKDRLIICQISDKMTGAGIPLEFMAFTDLTDWDSYSRISALMLEKALLLSKETDLKIYQSITSTQT